MSTCYFRYKDAKGNITLREIEVISRNSIKLSGYCVQSDRAFRTFRSDRIIEFLSDSEYLEEIGSLPPIPPSSVIANNSKSQGLSILFTGFKKNRRDELESSARSAGMQIKKDSVSKNLDFICGGYNAGPAKLKKADSLGIKLLDEGSFIHMISTGELLQDE